MDTVYEEYFRYTVSCEKDPIYTAIFTNQNKDSSQKNLVAEKVNEANKKNEKTVSVLRKHYPIVLSSLFSIRLVIYCSYLLVYSFVASLLRLSSTFGVFF